MLPRYRAEPDAANCSFMLDIVTLFLSLWLESEAAMLNATYSGKHCVQADGPISVTMDSENLARKDVLPSLKFAFGKVCSSTSGAMCS